MTALIVTHDSFSFHRAAGVARDVVAKDSVGWAYMSSEDGPVRVPVADTQKYADAGYVRISSASAEKSVAKVLLRKSAWGDRAAIQDSGFIYLVAAVVLGFLPYATVRMLGKWFSWLFEPA